MESFVLYAEQWPAIALLDARQKAELLQAVFSLHGACEMPELDVVTNAIFLMMKPRFNANKAKYQEVCEKRRAAGAKGGIAKGENTLAKKQMLNCEKQNSLTVSESESDSDTDSDFKKTDASHLAQSDADASSAPKPEQEPCVAHIPLADGSEWGVPESFAAELAAAYPAVPVSEELARCRAWCLANPKNCKTRVGVRRFVNSWFSRAQDKAPVARASPSGVDNRTWAQKREAEVMQEFLQGA